MDSERITGSKIFDEGSHTKAIWPGGWECFFLFTIIKLKAALRWLDIAGFQWLWFNTAMPHTEQKLKCQLAERLNDRREMLSKAEYFHIFWTHLAASKLLHLSQIPPFKMCPGDMNPQTLEVPKGLLFFRLSCWPRIAVSLLQNAPTHMPTVQSWCLSTYFLKCLFYIISKDYFTVSLQPVLVDMGFDTTTFHRCWWSSHTQ